MWKLGISLLCMPLLIVAESANPVEIGTIKWGRSITDAKTASKKSGKPIFLLFQEVPGCAGCKNFGKTVLSHPLLKEAVETAFEPVVIYNNQRGMDDEVRKAFGEPAWNYQVVRFLDHNGKDLITRKDKVWTIDGVAARMQAALRAAKRPVPNYLTAIEADARRNQHAVVAFAMGCFWTGEAKLGAFPGVTATEAGWLDGREVTLVHYDANQLKFSELIAGAKAARCAQKGYVTDTARKRQLTTAGIPVGTLDKSYRRAKTSDQKRQLIGIDASRIKSLNTTQLTKLNAFVRINKQTALSWLSPSQQKMLMK